MRQERSITIQAHFSAYFSEISFDYPRMHKSHDNITRSSRKRVVWPSVAAVCAICVVLISMYPAVHLGSSLEFV